MKEKGSNFIFLTGSKRRREMELLIKHKLEEELSMLWSEYKYMNTKEDMKEHSVKIDNKVKELEDFLLKNS